ncbi:MAG TPA: hypothetical protein VLH14_02380, partial [Patescibacteria group bacterium]|nr:hypothetical protein [Patescibacteria group bacterium]
MHITAKSFKQLMTIAVIVLSAAIILFAATYRRQIIVPSIKNDSAVSQGLAALQANSINSNSIVNNSITGTDIAENTISLSNLQSDIRSSITTTNNNTTTLTKQGGALVTINRELNNLLNT